MGERRKYGVSGGGGWSYEDSTSEMQRSELETAGRVTPIEAKTIVPSHSRDAGDTSGKMEGIHRPRYPISNIQFGYGRLPTLRALVAKGASLKVLSGRELQLQLTNHWVVSRSSHVLHVW